MLFCVTTSNSRIWDLPNQEFFEYCIIYSRIFLKKINDTSLKFHFFDKSKKFFCLIAKLLDFLTFIHLYLIKNQTDGNKQIYSNRAN